MTTTPDVPNLETPRLRLDPVHESDVDEIYRIYSDPEVIRYFGQDRMADIEQARFWMAVQHRMRDIGLGMTWCLREKSSGQIIGTACFDGINRQWHNVGISYVIQAASWNKGFATEALDVMIKLAFSGWLGCPIHRIQALVFPENLPSHRLLKKLGFIQEGRRLGLLFWQERYWDLDSYCLINHASNPAGLAEDPNQPDISSAT